MTKEEWLLALTERKRAYQLAFGSPAGKAVIDDLVEFCRGKATCVILGDRDATFVLEGRREVFLRIQDYLDLTPAQLLMRHTKEVKNG